MLFVPLVSVFPAQAATIVVDGNCTLVDAIDAANTDLAVGGCGAGDPGQDVIELATTVLLSSRDNGTHGDNGTPSVTSTIVIEGDQRSVRRVGSDEFRIFHVAESGDLTLRDLFIEDGDSDNWDYGAGGAVYNLGTLTLEGCVLIGNAGQKTGGAIYAGPASTTTLRDTKVLDNSCYCFSGSGGGIHNEGTMLIEGSEISGNEHEYVDGEGGGIANRAEGTLTLVDSLVSDNVASAAGGGVHNWGSVTIQSSTLAGNALTGEFFYYQGAGGGGLVNYGTAEIVNSTISNNVAVGAQLGVVKKGGGILNTGFLTLRNTTMSGNEATDNSESGDSLYNSFGTIELSGTVLIDQDGDLHCAGPASYVDLGGNFGDDGSCPGFDTIASGVDIDPELRDNGGPTETHALLPGSVAVDASGDCGLPTDQRGLPRSDGSCDSGSVEAQRAGRSDPGGERYLPRGDRGRRLGVRARSSRSRSSRPISSECSRSLCRPARG